MMDACCSVGMSAGWYSMRRYALPRSSIIMKGVCASGAGSGQSCIIRASSGSSQATAFSRRSASTAKRVQKASGKLPQATSSYIASHRISSGRLGSAVVCSGSVMIE